MKQLKNITFIPILIAVICTFLMILSIFFPYATAKEEFVAELKNSNLYSSQLKIDNKELINPSLLTYTKIYKALSPESAIIFGCLLAIIAFLCIMTLIFTLCKRPIAMIIFDILSLFLFTRTAKFQNSFINVDNYNRTITFYLFIISAIIILLCAIFLIIEKYNNKNKIESI